MRGLYGLNQYRDTSSAVVQHFGGIGDDMAGVFRVSREGVTFIIIASNGDGWDHVSVSLPDRCPTWDEMSFIKRLFFEPTELALQMHVPDDEHVDYHPYCLHLWRPHYTYIPEPPSIFVGPNSAKGRRNN